MTIVNKDVSVLRFYCIMRVLQTYRTAYTGVMLTNKQRHNLPMEMSLITTRSLKFALRVDDGRRTYKKKITLSINFGGRCRHQRDFFHKNKIGSGIQ